MTGRIVFEMELTPETVADGPSRYYLRVEIAGAIRSRGFAASQSPTGNARVIEPSVYLGDPIVVLSGAATTAKGYGWFQADEGADEIVLGSTGDVNLSGRGSVDTAEQTSGPPSIGLPLGWIHEGFKTLVAQSCPFDTDHPQSLWYRGNSTDLTVVVMEFESGGYTVNIASA